MVQVSRLETALHLHSHHSGELEVLREQLLLQVQELQVGAGGGALCGEVGCTVHCVMR